MTVDAAVILWTVHIGDSLYVICLCHPDSARSLPELFPKRNEKTNLEDISGS